MTIELHHLPPELRPTIPAKTKSLNNMSLKAMEQVLITEVLRRHRGNRKAAARLDYAHRLMRWMEHYVTGPGGEMPPVDLEDVVERVVGDGEEGEEG